MKRLITSLFALFTVFAAFATAQTPDKILYKGKEYRLASNPMEEFFTKHPELRPKGTNSTALWRGYVATFEVVGKHLMLKNIEIKAYNAPAPGKNVWTPQWESMLDQLSPDGKPLELDWYTGILVIPTGTLKKYVHMGYASQYSHYLLLEFDQGVLRKKKKMDADTYAKFKKRQFEAFKLTEEYARSKNELQASGKYTDELIDDFLEKYVIDYSSKILVK